MPLASTESLEFAQMFVAQPAAAYADGVAEVADHLRLLHARLARAVRARRGSDADGFARLLGGVAVSDAEIDAFLETPPFEAMPRDEDGPDEDHASHIAFRTIATARLKRDLPLAALKARFQLGEAEADALLLCLAWEVHPGYGRLCAYLHDDIARRRPSVGLLLDLFGGDWRDRTELRRLLAADGRLLGNGLLVAIAGDGPSAELAVAPAVLDGLLGGSFERGLKSAPPARPLHDLLLSAPERAALARIAGDMEAAGATGQASVVALGGSPGAGRRSAAAAICARVGTSLYEFDGAPGESAALDAWLKRVRIAGGVPFLRFPADRPEEIAALARALAGAGLPAAFVAVDGSAARLRWPAFVQARSVDIEPPSEEFRARAWRDALRDAGLRCAARDIDHVAAVYPQTVGQIFQAARQVAGDRPKGRAAAITRRDELGAACQMLTSHRLGQLAQRLTSRYRWEDIVLPPDEMQRMREIADAVRHRDRVRERWGFDRIGFGRGISALFVGPSGTGKTMAASILANDLGMEIFRIDLSRVVSKYIGETEKNLDAIFEEAQRAFALLFFDEAEALFGKRSEVKDAHDRYSNIETAYLLQRIEAFDGVAILATNLRKNMDAAFSRRLQFAVEFPLPGRAERLTIWRQAWPDATHTAPDLDLDFMAGNFEVAGGHIRNIALTSAYLAARDDGPVTMANVVAATRREFQKLGRLCLDEQFGPYAHLAAEQGR